MSFDGTSSSPIDFEFENRTNEDVHIQLKNVCINDCEVGCANNGNTVPAGTMYRSITGHRFLIDPDDFAIYGIQQIQSFRCCFSITEGDNILNVILDIPCNIGSNTEEASILSHVRENTEELYVDNNLFVGYSGIENYSSSRLVLNLCFINTSDYDMNVRVRNCTINNCLISLANSSATIPSGSIYFALPKTDLFIDVEDFETYDIETVESVSFDIVITNPNTMETTTIPIDWVR